MHDDVFKGAMLILLSELLFVLMGTLVKTVSAGLPNEMIVFFRNLFGLQIIIPLLLQQGLGALRTEHAPLHLLRGLAGVSAMYCFFYAIAHMQLANAMVLKLSAPLFIPIIAWLWLQEKLNWTIGFAVLLGFGGVALIVKPDLGLVDPIALIALAGGLFAAIAKSTVKKLTRTELPGTIVFYFAVTGLLVSSVPAFISWQTPSMNQLLLLLLLGTLASLAQFVMTRAYGFAPASKISPFSYSAVLYASLLGWLFWDEWMDSWAWLGAALIVIAGVMLLRRRRFFDRKVQVATEPD